MYLHIGKDEMIKRENILFLLDYKGLRENKIFLDFWESIPKEDKIDISLANPKTAIITKEKQKVKAYLSNISSNTLASRKMFHK